MFIVGYVSGRRTVFTLLLIVQQMLAGLLPDPLRHGRLQGHRARLPQLQGHDREARRVDILRLKNECITPIVINIFCYK